MLTNSIKSLSRLTYGLRQCAIGALGVSLFLGLWATSHAQIFAAPSYSNGPYRIDPEVIIFSECGFNGHATRVPLGQHSKIKNLGFANDAVSSIKIPAGVSVQLFKDDRFKGAAITLAQSTPCLDRYWNNQASSIKVDINRLDQPKSAPWTKHEYTRGADQLQSLRFENSVLTRESAQKWQLRAGAGGRAPFSVVRQTQSTLALKSDISQERIRIDLTQNTVTYTAGAGLSQVFAIQNKQWRNGSWGGKDYSNEWDRGKMKREKHSFKSNCVSYKAYSDGGNAAIRFQGKDLTERFSSRAVTGRVCHTGSLTMEINKTDLDTHVVVEIQGKRLVFARNEAPLRLLNNWYRKEVRLVLGR